MSNINPASPKEIEKFYKAASAHLSALGVAPEYHEALLNNELAAQYDQLTKGAEGEATPPPAGGAPAPKAKKYKPVPKGQTTTTAQRYRPPTPKVPAAGGKSGLLKNVLIGLGIGGAALGGGAALASKKKEPTAEAPKKEAMDKTIEGGLANGTIKNTSSKAMKEKMKGKNVTYSKPKGLPPGAQVTGIEVKESSANKVAEDIAAMALFKAAKDHMVNDLKIPEKQAQEILKNHFGIK